MQQVENELRRANRFDRPLTIIMADLDLLRNINNTYGHLAGDEVLVKIAAILKESVREYDVVARFGGEEFAILMLETEAHKAFERAERIRQTIEKTQFVVSTSVTPIRVTISIGIASRERFDEPAQEIIHNADTALYHSKLKGRNQTYICANQAYESLLSHQASSEFRVVPTNAEAPAFDTSHAEPEAYRAAQAMRVSSVARRDTADSLSELSENSESTGAADQDTSSALHVQNQPDEEPAPGLKAPRRLR
jgi:diguanylate cyclase (GGDEF)-like protein